MVKGRQLSPVYNNTYAHKQYLRTTDSKVSFCEKEKLDIKAFKEGDPGEGHRFLVVGFPLVQSFQIDARFFFSNVLKASV